jgi:hypothetical protein
LQVQMPNAMEPSPRMHPFSSRAFQRHQEHDVKHPGSVDFTITKQNKLPSFIDRLTMLKKVNQKPKKTLTLWTLSKTNYVTFSLVYLCRLQRVDFRAKDMQ